MLLKLRKFKLVGWFDALFYLTSDNVYIKAAKLVNQMFIF